MSETITLAGIVYSLLPLEPNIVFEMRHHARTENATTVAELSSQHQRSIVQLALRKRGTAAMPFSGPRGGLELETVVGRERLIEVGQDIAERHQIFKSGAIDGYNAGSTEGAATE